MLILTTSLVYLIQVQSQNFKWLFGLGERAGRGKGGEGGGGGS